MIDKAAGIIRGEAGRYLDVDLDSLSFSVHHPNPEDLSNYLGGKGLGLKIIYDRLGSQLGQVDSLAGDNILAFLTGAILGSGAPSSARFAGITKSPLTGLMLSSSCGGSWGMAARSSGWDGLIIRGRADRPVILYMDHNGARFEDAGATWGMETSAAQAQLVTEKNQGALVIGPAGENLVPYAVIRSGNRYLGRGGMGAVMGSKNLKAVVAQGGTYTIEAAWPELFAQRNRRAKIMMKRNSFTSSFRAYGTNYAVNPGVDAGFAPVRNFRDRSDERCRALSGQAMAERYNTKPAACAACTILCGHAGLYPDGVKRHIPEYETIGLWGGNLLNFDPDLVGVLNDRMNELGLDTISAGGTVAWAMEAAEKGIRPSNLAFGKTDNLASILDDIAWRRNEGAELALGSRALARRYGGMDFAIQVKGMEMAAYDPRAGWGQGLNYAIANRGGCHLNAYPIALEALFNFIPPYSTLSKVSWVCYLEDLFSAVNSVHTCQFTVFAYLLEPPVAKYTPKPILKLAMTLAPALAQGLLDYSTLSGLYEAMSGRKTSMHAFKTAGCRTHVLERYMNIRCGLQPQDDSLPARFTDEAITRHPRASVVPVAKMVLAYYRKKGYDHNGRPTARTLQRLGIQPLDERAL